MTTSRTARTGALLLVAVSLISSACQFEGARLQEKAPSFHPYGDVRVEGVPLQQFLAERTALLGLHVEFNPDEPGRATVDGRATATAITADGYFLTAAHAVEDNSPYVLHGHRSRPRKLRVVWSGYSDGEGEDLALCHAPVRGMKWFEWAGEECVVPGRSVVAAGFPEWDLHVAGGVLEGVEEQESARRLRHSTPLSRGDSGGPLINLEGKLLGINIGGKGVPMIPELGYVTFSIRPRLPMIDRLIELDRESRAARHPG